MSMTEPPRTASAAEVRAPARDTFRSVVHDGTKPSFMTTEFWLALAGVAALVIVYNTSDNPSMDLFRTCLLCTIIGAAYFVSRGLAKSGSHRRYDRYDDRY